MSVEKSLRHFIMVTVAAEQALGLPGEEVEAIQERTIAFRASALAFEENVVAVLNQNPAAIGEALLHLLAGVLVAVLIIASPNHPRLARPVHVDRHGPHPALLAFEILDQRQAALLGELNPLEALLDLKNFAGIACEWRLKSHNAVTIGNFVLQISAIQGFHPHQRRGLAGPPLDIARSGRNAAQADALLERQAGDLVNYFPAVVPNFDLPWKRAER